MSLKEATSIRKNNKIDKNKCIRHFQRHLFPYWKTFVVLVTPLLLLLLPLLYPGTETRAAYGILLITIYWMTSALPLAITSLLPIVVFPLADVLSTSRVSSLYFKQTNFIFFGGIVLALGVEQCNLHRRIALRVILTVGSNPRWLMLGLMSVSMFLSMWLSNAAVTAMLIPIVEAVVHELFQQDVEHGDNSDPLIINEAENSTKPNNNDKGKFYDHRGKVLMPFLLAVNYASSIGGTATLIGSGTTMVLKGIVEELHGPETSLTFATWMALGVPVALVNILIAWFWIQILFMRFCRTIDGLRGSKDLKISIREQYHRFGPMTFHEKAITFLGCIILILWLSKDPQFMPGWQDTLPLKNNIGDATVIIAIVIMAFIIPAKLDFWCFNKSNQDEKVRASPALIDWKYVQKRFPWNILFLLGCGYAISEASKVSGLSSLIGDHLTTLRILSPFSIMVLMCLIASAMTQVASNAVVVSILLPVVSPMAEAIQIDPLYFMIPVTITSCYAYMLPAGSPCNAIVFATGKIHLSDMMKAGAVMIGFTNLALSP